MYRIIRFFLFFFSPEAAHQITAVLLKMMRYVPFAGKLLHNLLCFHSPALEREVMGIKFKNPIGLAAGLDKNGALYNDFSNFGFAFVEIGSITPLPQPGNPKPRCYRLVPDEAIINRFGMNNVGVANVVRNIQQQHPHVIIGGNISKNTLTPNEKAADDYEYVFNSLYDYVDYFVINVSCPNVEDLCKLHDIDLLSGIICRLIEIRANKGRYRPVLLKISPDLNFEQLDNLIEFIMKSGLDGVVATNTTVSREGLITPTNRLQAIGNGGLSGAPLKKRALEVIRHIHQKTEGRLPIIGSGGVMTPKDAIEMIQAGASLVQIYTGFIYNGPTIVKKVLKHIINS